MSVANGIMAFAIPVHMHIGMNACITDYLPKAARGEARPLKGWGQCALRPASHACACPAPTLPRLMQLLELWCIAVLGRHACAGQAGASMPATAALGTQGLCGWGCWARLPSRSWGC